MRTCSVIAAALAVSLLLALWTLSPPLAPAADVAGNAAHHPQSPTSEEDPRPEKPAAVTALEAAFGGPSPAGFGSAVFYVPLAATSDLDAAAHARYRYFVGDLWERYGEAAVSSGCAWVMSCVCAPVSTKCKGLPGASVVPCTFVPKPPRLRPNACADVPLFPPVRLPHTGGHARRSSQSARARGPGHQQSDGAW